MPPKGLNAKQRVMWDAYRAHRDNARRRRIPFLFTFEQWVAWWMTGDRWSRRGRTKDALVMARPGDSGPYSPNNVVCITQNENLHEPCHDMSPSKKQRRRLLAKRIWANPDRWDAVRRGASHPRSKPVMTPAGKFESAGLAAKAFEISPRYAAMMARRGIEGWHYI